MARGVRGGDEPPARPGRPRDRPQLPGRHRGAAAEQSVRDEEQRRQTLLEGIISAETRQSSRIAEELHDDTIQIMTASLVELDRVDRQLREGDVDAARDGVARARTALMQATDRTRRLTFELRPQLLEAAGLGPAVRDLASSLRRDTRAVVKVRTRVGRYPVDIETLVYRTIREVLINVRKHARAENVWINITERHGNVAATIRDDGRGFTAREAPVDHVAPPRSRDRSPANPGDGRTVRRYVRGRSGHNSRDRAAGARRPRPARGSTPAR